MNDNIIKKYKRWLSNVNNIKLLDELKNMKEFDIEDSFYSELSFGTGGLRGILGVGSNRLNIYTIAKATQGLANYLNSTYKYPSVVIGYDTRINSDLFSKTTAEVFAANNIKVNIYKEHYPVPMVSFGIRYLQSSAGVMITASHNSSKYNGYKVYGNDGCQITLEAADIIQNEINKIDPFKDVKQINFNDGISQGIIKYINDDCYTSYIEEIKKQSVLYGEEVNKNLSIIYSPLSGTGLKPVLRVLKESEYNNVIVVKEQENPNGNFPTCPYPNPEIKESMLLGIEYAKKNNADILLASDPDCDRVGIAVKDNNDYKLLSGNETGMLLFDYICSQKLKHNMMPKDPLLVKTIVTIDMAESIAKNYKVNVKNVLTGFKFIGEQIGILEKNNLIDNYVFGFEESYGYLSGTYVRDKDGVNAIFLIVEMFSYYKMQGINLIDKLESLYKKYGYYLNTLHSYEFDGLTGFTKMKTIMKKIRNGFKYIGNKKVLEIIDYIKGIDGLPCSDVIKYVLDNNCSIVIRPSGTEPKIKAYISINSKNKEDLIIIEKEIANELNTIINS